jgi:hypothetical protein
VALLEGVAEALPSPAPPPLLLGKTEDEVAREGDAEGESVGEDLPEGLLHGVAEGELGYVGETLGEGVELLPNLSKEGEGGGEAE